MTSFVLLFMKLYVKSNWDIPRLSYVQIVEFICHTCGKKCKSNSGLKRHTSAKQWGCNRPYISGNVDELTTDLLAQIVKETTLKVAHFRFCIYALFHPVII